MQSIQGSLARKRSKFPIPPTTEGTENTVILIAAGKMPIVPHIVADDTHLLDPGSTLIRRISPQDSKTLEILQIPRNRRF